MRFAASTMAAPINDDHVPPMIVRAWPGNAAAIAARISATNAAPKITTIANPAATARSRVRGIAHPIRWRTTPPVSVSVPIEM